VTAAQVLHESGPGGEYPQPRHGLDPTHRAQPTVQLRVLGLDRVMRAPRDMVPRRVWPFSTKRPQARPPIRIGRIR
jgi:hypothetical protein